MPKWKKAVRFKANYLKEGRVFADNDLSGPMNGTGNLHYINAMTLSFIPSLPVSVPAQTITIHLFLITKHYFLNII